MTGGPEKGTPGTPETSKQPSLYDQIERTLAEIATEPHYRVRNGKILHDRKTGQPLTAKGPAEEAAKLLATLRRNPGVLGQEPGHERSELHKQSGES